MHLNCKGIGSTLTMIILRYYLFYFLDLLMIVDWTEINFSLWSFYQIHDCTNDIVDLFHRSIAAIQPSRETTLSNLGKTNVELMAYMLRCYLYSTISKSFAFFEIVEHGQLFIVFLVFCYLDCNDQSNMSVAFRLG